MNEKASVTAKKLFKKLKEFHNNKDFVLGVMSNAPHDKDMEFILKFMNNVENVTV